MTSLGILIVRHNLETDNTLLSPNAEQRAQLQRPRDTHPKPYIPERAAAPLKLADGHALGVVARAGLLRPRSCTTVRTRLQRFHAEEITRLDIRQGRGRISP